MLPHPKSLSLIISHHKRYRVFTKSHQIPLVLESLRGEQLKPTLYIIRTYKHCHNWKRFVHELPTVMLQQESASVHQKCPVGLQIWRKNHATEFGNEKRNRKNIVNDCHDNRMGSKAMVKSVQEYWHDDNDMRGWQEGQCFVFKRASAQHCWAADREG